MDEDKTLQDTVSEETNEAAIAASQQVDYLVKQMSADLDKLSEQIKEQKQMVKDTLESDSRYQAFTEKVKDINKQKQALQKEIGQGEAFKKAKAELEDLSGQKKVLTDKLSDYLRQYIEQFNSRTLEDLQGNLKQIITQYKLVKQKTSE